MGSWNAWHLVLGPGERDPERVAAELRAALPDALADVVHDGVDLDRLLGEHGPDVWVADGLVHYATGKDLRIQPYSDGWTDLVRSLPVPARWACAAFRQEVDAGGGAELFGWVGGGYVPLDRPPGQGHSLGYHELGRAERWWDVTGSTETLAPRDRQAGPDDPVAEPGPVPGFEPVDRDSLPDVETALARLADGDPARRREAAEQLYVLVTERDASPGLDPRLFAALDDDPARFAAGATVHALAPTEDELRAALTHGDPARRRAACRFCFLQGPPDATTAGEQPLDRTATVPTEALVDRLSDPDPTVRAAAARALDRSAIDGHADPPAGAVDALLAAADDPDPRVRAEATVAAARFALQHGRGDGERAVDALVAGLTDADPAVSRRITTAGLFFGIRRATSVNMRREVAEDAVPDRRRLLLALCEADARGDLERSDPVTTHVEATASSEPVVEPVLADLVALGWAEDGALARTAVERAASRTDLPVAAALADAGVDPDAAL
jgi:hypothetical protein